MQLVIELPDEEYKLYRHLYDCGMGSPAIRRILNGKRLPKGHGRIGDLDELQKVLNVYVLNDPDCPMHIASEICYNIDCFETIIEADKEGAEND